MRTQVNAWGDQPTLEMVRLIVEWGGFCFLDKDKRGDFKVLNLLCVAVGSNWRPRHHGVYDSLFEKFSPDANGTYSCNISK